MDSSTEATSFAEHGWQYTHPPLGTCFDSCAQYGWCHCGCGERPTLAKNTVEDLHRLRGEPFIFRAGHHARVFRRQAGHWSKHGVPVERVRPLLAWLHERHGTWASVAELLQMPKGTIKGYANNSGRRRVPPESARRIQQLVLAHRKRASFLSQWETKPGLRERSPWWRMTGPV
jgi:hypothetical protein